MTDSSETYRKMVDDPKIQDEVGKDPRLCKSVKQDDGLSWSPAIFYLPSQGWWQERLAGELWCLWHTPPWHSRANVRYSIRAGIHDFNGDIPEECYAQFYMWVHFGKKWDGKEWVK